MLDLEVTNHGELAADDRVEVDLQARGEAWTFTCGRTCSFSPYPVPFLNSDFDDVQVKLGSKKSTALRIPLHVSMPDYVWKVTLTAETSSSTTPFGGTQQESWTRPSIPSPEDYSPSNPCF